MKIRSSIPRGRPPKIEEGGLEQPALQFFDLRIFNRTAVQLFEIKIVNDRSEIVNRQIDGRSRSELEHGRLYRDGADRIVRAVISTSFVDRQQLHDLETGIRRPIDKLAQRRQVADPEVVLST